MFGFSGKLRVLQCPYILDQNSRPEVTACLGSILLGRGYAAPQTLQALLQSWHSMFDLVKPDLVMFDYAPTPLIASKGYSFKKVLVGSGFAELKPDLPCRVLLPWSVHAKRDAAQHESHVVDVINSILLPDTKPVKYISDLFNADLTLLTTLPELDHYQRDPDKTLYIKPDPHNQNFQRVAWKDKGKPKVFVYLKAQVQATKSVIYALQNLNYDVICCCPDMTDKVRNRISTENLRVFSQPVYAGELIETADLVINHASKELVYETLLAGAPQLVCPSQLEQTETSRMIEQLGVGVTLPRAASVEQTMYLIMSVIGNASFRQASQLIAGRYKNSTRLFSYSQVIRSVERLVHQAG
ncbi:glycosyltransferase [Aliamphritea hakodatensis]|uniref:glycosyltransferase n=1 Tax=Aliamphritea hakodatensis TaxID=2895352 RepID=UPI0022FD43B7|nr:hypothetical protein [Aliamphritea hakodatensis]